MNLLQSLNLAPHIIKVGRRGIFEAYLPQQAACRRSDRFRSVGVFLKVMSRRKDSSFILEQKPEIISIQLAKILDTKISQCGILSESEITSDSVS